MCYRAINNNGVYFMKPMLNIMAPYILTKFKFENAKGSSKKVHK